MWWWPTSQSTANTILPRFFTFFTFLWWFIRFFTFATIIFRGLLIVYLFDSNRLWTLLDHYIPIEIIIAAFLWITTGSSLRYLLILLLSLLFLLVLLWFLFNLEIAGCLVVHIHPKLITPFECHSWASILNTQAHALLTTLNLDHFSLSWFFFAETFATIRLSMGKYIIFS